MAATKLFRNKFDKIDMNVCESGRREKPTYKAYYDVDGTLCLKEDGKINTYDEIQSHKESCDIYAVIAKCKLLGSDEPLKQRQGFYGDFVGSPKSLSEALNLVERGKEEFMSLPLEVREKFGHDYKKYISTAGSSAWYANVGSLFEQPSKIEQPKVELEVKEEGVVSE